MQLSQEEKAKRAKNVETVFHSQEIEGGRINDEDKKLFALYVNGEIELSEITEKLLQKSTPK